MIGKPRDLGLIPPKLATVTTQTNRHARVAELLVLELRRERGLGLAVRDEELGVARAKRAQRAEETGGFEKVGFPLPVGAEEKLLASVECERGKAHIAKVSERELTEPHSVKDETQPSREREENLGSADVGGCGFVSCAASVARVPCPTHEHQRPR